MTEKETELTMDSKLSEVWTTICEEKSKLTGLQFEFDGKTRAAAVFAVGSEAEALIAWAKSREEGRNDDSRN